MERFAERWAQAPARHRTFLDRAMAVLADDARVCGVAVGGSLATGTTDEYSDLDLVIVVTDAARPSIMAERKALADGLGPLLQAFTGEHVGEPRLLICLFGPPLLHVDLKFIGLDELRTRVEDPVILGERDGALSAVLAASTPVPPSIDRTWMAERFYVWIHYGTDHALRGELFECLDMLTFIRARVLGPMMLYAAGYRGLAARSVRRIETRAAARSAALIECVGSHDRDACLRALRNACALYAELRAELDADDGATVPEERAVVAYLDAAISAAP